MNIPRTLPFLSLSRDAQLMIYMKMSNVTLIRMISTCSDANNFVERYKTQLSCRPHEGTDFQLWDGTNVICVWAPKHKFVAIAVNEDFCKNMEIIVVNELKIKFKREENIPEVLEALSRWRPKCNYATVPNYVAVAGEKIAEMNFLKTIKIRLSDDPRAKLDTLKRIKNKGKFDIHLDNEWNGEDLLEYIYHFGRIRMPMTINGMNNLFSDFHKVDELGVLSHLEFSIMGDPFGPRIPKFPYLPKNSNSLPFKCLFINNKTDIFPLTSIQKLSLKNNKCALIEEYRTNAYLTIIVDLIKDDDNAILDYLGAKYSEYNKLLGNR